MNYLLQASFWLSTLIILRKLCHHYHHCMCRLSFTSSFNQEMVYKYGRNFKFLKGQINSLIPFCKRESHLKVPYVLRDVWSPQKARCKMFSILNGPLQYSASKLWLQFAEFDKLFVVNWSKGEIYPTALISKGSREVRQPSGQFECIIFCNMITQHTTTNMQLYALYVQVDNYQKLLF